jgi:diamine N-acetyltransferase
MTTATEPIINILGERVALGPRVREQIPLFARWRNDFFVQRTAGSLPAPITIEATTTQFEEWATGEGGYNFVIYERATWRPIGLTHLSEVDWRGRTAAFGIVLGEADARGRGYGTEATRLLLNYAFTALGLHSVMLITDSFNLAGQAAYRKAGFKEFGRRRQCSLLRGELLDLVYMDCLASEFSSPVLGAIFTPDTPR